MYKLRLGQNLNKNHGNTSLRWCKNLYSENVEERTKIFQTGVTNIVNDYVQLLLNSTKQGVSQVSPPSQVT